MILQIIFIGVGIFLLGLLYFMWAITKQGQGYSGKDKD